eukprot:SAG31_NODE_366_length_16817_cov_17.317921_20_plen_339_part_00
MVFESDSEPTNERGRFSVRAKLTVMSVLLLAGLAIVGAASSSALSSMEYQWVTVAKNPDSTRSTAADGFRGENWSNRKAALGVAQQFANGLFAKSIGSQVQQPIQNNSLLHQLASAVEPGAQGEASSAVSSPLLIAAMNSVTFVSGMATVANPFVLAKTGARNTSAQPKHAESNNDSGTAAAPGWRHADAAERLRSPAGAGSFGRPGVGPDGDSGSTEPRVHHSSYATPIDTPNTVKFREYEFTHDGHLSPFEATVVTPLVTGSNGGGTAVESAPTIAKPIYPTMAMALANVVDVDEMGLTESERSLQNDVEMAREEAASVEDEDDEERIAAEEEGYR